MRNEKGASGGRPAESIAGKDFRAAIAAVTREALEMLAREWPAEYPAGAVERLIPGEACLGAEAED